MRALFLTALLTLGILSQAAATDYYVSSGANSLVTGVDALGGGRGLSPGLPFATMQFAHDQTAPGDVVYVRQGTYRPPYSSGPGLQITRSGTPSAWIVYRNYPGDAQRPLLQFMSFQGIYITQGASYIEINGFRVQGNNRNITLADALNQPGSCANPTGSASGVYAGNGISSDANGGNPHHLRFINNEVFECGGAGIATNNGDYVTIDNNLVYNNCWYSKYGNSGISMNSSRNFDTAPGYHMFITRNRVFGNRLYVPWRSGTVCQGITDGNGIILDLNTTTNPATNYTNTFLVANNLIVNNGGGAIQVFKTANVDVINNTCYQNSRSPELYSGRGEIFTNFANTVLVQNNIMVADYITKANSNNQTPNLTYTNNLTFGGIGTDVLGTNAIVADPQFIKPSVDPFTSDFRFFPTSPAIDAGLNSQLSATDLTGQPRVVGTGVDLGAIEYNATLSPSFTTWVGGGSTDFNTAANWSAGVPSVILDGYIPANAAPYPVIATTTTVRDLVIGAGASLTLNGGVLDIKGSLSNSGTMTATPGASITLSGTASQGLGGPSTLDVWNLTLNNVAGAGLAGRVRVHGVLNLTNGTLAANDRLTLVSDASGTALVNNAGTGTVTGYTTVQRYIDGSVNPGLGYRHYSSPVAGTTVGDLASSGFTPEISQAAVYNASATPGTTTPFPNVFGYDQSRVSLTNNYTPFDRGFVAPVALTTGLTPGRGYVANITASQVVDYVGVLNSGTLAVALTRNAAGTTNDTDAGWQLLGNPFPSPLDYSQVVPADRTNLDAAIYVFSSTSQYAGTYRSYANGVGNPMLPLGQGFFTRVSAGQTTGTITFRNSQRLTTPNNTPFQRGTADVRPQVQLTLQGSTGTSDAFYAYAENGATPNFDAQYDAVKLPNTTGLNLASVAGSGEALSIDGRPVFTANTVLPLTVGVPAAGSYALTAAALTNLPANLDAVLTDALTGQTVNLRTQPAYAFSVSPAAANALIVGRFALHFAARAALATAPALTAAEVSLYPNPAHSAFTVLVPAVAGATQVHTELLNGLGQVVRHQEAALPAAGARLSVEANGLAAGIYTLRLQVGAATLAKRVVLQ